jgi:long-chain acyl-CoA synthetase
MSLNLSTILIESALQRPSHTAVIHDDLRLTYEQLLAEVNKCANVLKGLGMEPGDKVAMVVPNSAIFPIVYYGILLAGGVVVPLNPLLKEQEIAYHLDDSDAVAVITLESLLAEVSKGFSQTETCSHIIAHPDQGGDNIKGDVQSLEVLMASASPESDVVQTMPEDPAVIIYTSGTTGKPKGAVLTHFNLFYNCQVTGEELMRLQPDDVLIAALPLFHSFGQTCSMNASFSMGDTLTMLPRFEVEAALKVIERDKVTIFQGVPTMFFYLLNFPELDGFDISSLRLAMSGGAAIPVEVLNAFEERFGVTVLEGYGLSETSPVASFNRSKERRRIGSIGEPIYGVEMKIFDEKDNETAVDEVGEVVIRGHNVLKEYYKKPEATKEAMRSGWFHTGDMGKMDGDGFFYIVDRKKDMIIRGGYNVYPREIEEVLYTFPGLVEAAVVGVPDEVMGENVKAFVALESGCAATEDDIIKYCKDRVAAYKYPRIVQIMPTLPKGATGKILKRDLRDLGDAQ